MNLKLYQIADNDADGLTFWSLLPKQGKNEKVLQVLTIPEKDLPIEEGFFSLTGTTFADEYFSQVDVDSFKEEMKILSGEPYEVQPNRRRL